MHIKFFVTLFLFISISTFSQSHPNHGDLDSHSYYVEQLNNSKDANYQRFLNLYDQYIDNNPDDTGARVEKCKFIGGSYYDEYEDYNLKYEETIACIEDLYQKYPSNPRVILYRAENLYGEERLAALLEALDLLSQNLKEWTDLEKSKVNEMLGNYYKYDDNSRLAIRYLEAAHNYNSDLDLSISIAELYIERGDEELAKDMLLETVDHDTIPWKLNSKARLLLEVGETNKALLLFRKVQSKDSTLINNAEMAKAMVDLKKPGLARDFLVKDTIGYWNKIEKVQNLFDHDLKYSEPKVMLNTYRTATLENSSFDFLAVKRLNIFFKDPFLSWRFLELLHLFFLLLVIAVLALTPYIWILPVFNIGLFIKKRKKMIIPSINFSWGLKHFWIISIIYLLSQFLIALIFYYTDYTNYFLDLGYIEEDASNDQALLAKGMLSYVILMFVGTLLVIKRIRIKYLYTSKISIWDSLRFIFGVLVFNTNYKLKLALNALM